MSAAPAKSVLVVDDEPTIAEIVARYLERAGYETAVAHDGEGALAAAAAHRPDLVVLDVMLPGVDGLRVLRRLRELHSDPLGVILLSARGEEADRVAGLRLGADDFVSKPFSPRELVARVDAVIRRLAPTADADPTLRFDDLVIDPRGRRACVDGADVALTAREFDVLVFMARHPGQAFSREQLLDAVWRSAVATDSSTVTVHVRRLRTKLERDPARPRHLQTVWGVGYRFQP